MPAGKDAPLVYTCVRAFTLPLPLVCSVRLPELPSDILRVTATVEEISGEVVQAQLVVEGRLTTLVRYAAAGGRLRVLERGSAFNITLPLQEELPPGHIELVPTVREVAYLLNTAHRQAQLEVRVHGEAVLKVMAVQPVDGSSQELTWLPLLLPEILGVEESTFHRELLLPLDPPALKIIRVEVREEGVEAQILPQLVVSGEAEEEVLYLGQDRRVHHLRHVSSWSYLFTGPRSYAGGSPQVSARGEVAEEAVLAGGYTLRLNLAEKVRVLVTRPRRLNVLSADKHTPAAKSVTVKARRVVAEACGSQLVTAPLPLPDPVTYLGAPQGRIRRLAAEPNPGQVLVSGQVEAQLPYVGADGKERTAQALVPLRFFLPAAAAQPGQQVEAGGTVENVEFVRSAGGVPAVRLLCSFQLQLLKEEAVELVTSLPAPHLSVATTPVAAKVLVGRGQADQLFKKSLRLAAKAESLSEISVTPGLTELRLSYGRLLASGNQELNVYYLTGDGRECCEHAALPWQVVLNIPAARPELEPEAEVTAHVLPAVLSHEREIVSVQGVVTLAAAVYTAAEVEVVTGVTVKRPGPVEGEPVLGLIQEQAEIEALVALPHPPAVKIEEVAAEVGRWTWRAEEEEVAGMGELRLRVTYSGRDGIVRSWQEKRSCALSFPCPAARQGLVVRGGLRVKEVSPQLLTAHGLPWGREVTARVVLAADLVLV